MSLVLLGLLASTNLAHAASPDLTTTITEPTGYSVYQSALWKVKVTNSGNRDAASTTVTIQLPETNTSPTVHVMGTLGSMSSTCAQSGTKLICNVGTVKKGTNKTVQFYLALPESAGSLDFSATAATTTAETNTSNNGSSRSASPANFSPSFTGTRDVYNRHCTGTGLESFFECELYPSSISAHDATFNDDGTISFALYPDYGGTWSVSGAELVFEYTTDGGAVVEASFVGYGVDGVCWEGLTTFPGSAYVSPYEVCLL